MPHIFSEIQSEGECEEVVSPGIFYIERESKNNQHLGFQIPPWALTLKGLNIIPPFKNAIELMGQIQLPSNPTVALRTAESMKFA